MDGLNGKSAWIEEGAILEHDAGPDAPPLARRWLGRHHGNWRADLRLPRDKQVGTGADARALSVDGQRPRDERSSRGRSSAAGVRITGPAALLNCGARSGCTGRHSPHCLLPLPC
jgi:hypothetical protein